MLMEFQFGLNWPGLTDYAGDVFGAPLAMETLVAFFLESTFLGLWIFGWDRLNRYVHLALIWLVDAHRVRVGVFIMVANSFLQNPVGYEVPTGSPTSPISPRCSPTRAFGMASRTCLARRCHRRVRDGWDQRLALHPAYARDRVLPQVVAAGRGHRRHLTIGVGFAQFAPVGAVQPTKFGDDAAGSARSPT